DRTLSRVADVFVAETANGQIRINDESASLRPGTGDVTPTATVAVTSGATAFVAGTLRLDLTITNAASGSTVAYAVLFDAGTTGTFATLANRSFVLSDKNQLYSGLEERSTPVVFFDDLSISAIGQYAPPAFSGLTWQGQVNNTWDTSTTNWLNGISGNYDMFSNGANVRFDDSASNTSVDLPITVLPGALSL